MLTRAQVDQLIEESRQADEGPTQFVRRIERAVRADRPPLLTSQEIKTMWVAAPSRLSLFEAFEAGVRATEARRHG